METMRPLARVILLNSCCISVTMAFSIMDDMNYMPFICSQGKNHQPRSADKRKKIKFWMFSAAFQGCLACTKFCIDMLGVDKDSESENRKYKALDWAQWGVEKGVDGAGEVVSYLQRLDQSDDTESSDVLLAIGNCPQILMAAGLGN